MGVSPGIQLQRRALCLGVALLLPASFMAAQASSSAPAVHGASGARAVIPPPAGVAPPPVNPSLGHDSSSVLPPAKHRAGLEVSPAKRLDKVSAESAYDIPLVAVNAYQYAASVVRRSAPQCHLKWTVIAAIGQIESNHGRFDGARVLTDGTTSPSIVGVPLNGKGDVARIRDTDRGSLDGDRVWDRAVGPMQFLPSTWAIVGVDGDQDGGRDPNDFDDAALATASYLCAGSGDMRVRADARAAVYRYNHSSEYVDAVLRIAAAYDRGDLKVLGATALSDVPDFEESRQLVTHRDRAASKRAEARADSAASRKAVDRAQDRQLTATAAGGDRSRQGNSDKHDGTSEPVRAVDSGGHSGQNSSNNGNDPNPPHPPGDGPQDPTPPTDDPPTTPPGGEPTGTPPPEEPTDTPPTDEPPETPPTETPEPSPTPTPSPDPTPTPDPQPEPTVELVGVLTVCADDVELWCVDDVELNLGVNPDLSVVQGDYDGDKDEESVVDELTGLVDERVAFLTDADGLVLQINDLDYVADELPMPRDGGPTGSKPATSAPTEAATTDP